MQDGDAALMDIHLKYPEYIGDMTRFPVNAKERLPNRPI